MCPVQTRNSLAGGLGFEPRFAESESAVLPLDDPPHFFVQQPNFKYGIKKAGIKPASYYFLEFQIMVSRLMAFH